VVVCLFAAYKIDNLEPQITLPTHAMPADNARDYFHSAFLASKLMKHKSPYDMLLPPAQTYTLANFQACAADAEPALKILREGLNHPFMNDAFRSVNTTFPTYPEFRELERVNAGAADYYTVTGNPGRAMQMRLDGMELGAMIPRGGVLISGLVGIACEAIAESRMEPLIPQLSSVELASAAVRLDRISAKRIPFAEIITEEGYTQAAYLLESLRDPKAKANPYQSALEMIGGDPEDETTTWRERMSVRLKALKFTMQSKQAIIRENSEWFAAMAEEARGVYVGPTKVKVPNNLVAELSAGVFDQARSKWVSMDASLNLLRVEVAVYRYKRDHGKFPSALADLAPTYLASVPDDPCGGKPLHYLLQNGGAGFQLYSIGPDLKDDGGVAGKFPGEGNTDIVAGKLWNKKPILYSGTAN
jgi:hypothetical protein